MSENEDFGSIPVGAESDNPPARKDLDLADVNTRFRSYVTLHSNLDNLIWRNISVMLTSTAIGGGLIGTLLTRPTVSIVGLSHSKTVAAAFLLLAVLYFISIFTLRRMRVHHILVEQQLRRMEPDGYFHERAESVRRWLSSATTWNVIVFGVFGIACVGAASYYWTKVEDQLPKTWLSSEQASSRYGIIANHEFMENGELRFRLMGSDGNGYIRTIAGEFGAWQNSHYHKKIRETYIVENGWIAIATPSEKSGDIVIKRYGVGGLYTTELNQIHNVYLSARAVVHTVKYGSIDGTSDWFAAPEFDITSKILSEATILER